jgi:hypothetical protein
LIDVRSAKPIPKNPWFCDFEAEIEKLVAIFGKEPG